MVMFLLLLCVVPLLHCCTLHEEYEFTGANGQEFLINDITDLGFAVRENDVDKIKKAMGNFEPSFVIICHAHFNASFLI